MENKTQIDLAKWLSGELSEAELSEFQKNPDYAVFEKIKNYSAALQTVTHKQEDEMLLKILHSKKKPKTISFGQYFYRIAAIIIVFIGIYFLYSTFDTQKQTQNSELLAFQLPDQSKVDLNADSKITFSEDNWVNERNITLAGEAYFEAKKGEKFTVTTALGKITVLGTRFNVKARNNRLDVTCYEGKVEVSNLDKKTILTPGKSVIVKQNSFITTTTNDEAPLWKNKILVFEKETLNSIVEELNRQYNIQIENTVENTKLFSGQIPANNITVALQTIATTYQVKIIKKSNTSYRLVNQ